MAAQSGAAWLLKHRLGENEEVGSTGALSVEVHRCLIRKHRFHKVPLLAAAAGLAPRGALQPLPLLG